MFHIIAFAFLTSSYVNGYPYEKELHGDLFANYSKFVFPSNIVGQPVNISIEAEMNYIIGLDEKTELLTWDLQLTVSWKDDTLVWEDTRYGGIKDIFVPVGQVWVPDLAIQNALTERRRLAKDDQLVQIRSDGTVNWICDYVGETLCPLNMNKYPFDTQNCTAFIESLAHGGHKVKIVSITAPSFRDVFQNGQWELLSTFCELTAESSGDSVALVTLLMKRRQQFYIISIVLPVVVTSCLNPFVFLLPTESGEKVALSTTMLLFYSVLLTYVFDNIPATSLSLPTIGIFVGGQLVLSALSLVCTVVMLHFNNIRKEKDKTDSSTEFEHDARTNKTLNLKTQTLFRRLNAGLFGVFALTEVIICLTIFILIQY